MVSIKKIMVVTCLGVALPVLAMAASQPKAEEVTVEGTVSGYDCAVHNMLCPVDHKGSHVATPGLLTDNKQWYFIVNIPSSFLTQYFLDRVEVTGTVFKPSNDAIEPKTIRLIANQGKKVIYENGQFVDAMGHKSSFTVGQFVNESWVCNQCAKMKK